MASLALAMGAGVLSYAWSGEVAAEPSAKEILLAVCDAKRIKGEECRQAKNYRGGPSCNLKLSGKPVEGRFLPGRAPFVAAVYQSDCDSHADNFGGMLLVERKGKAYALVEYLQGMVGSDCTRATTGETMKLFCISSYMGQGYSESSVFEVKFTANGRSVTAEMDRIASAGSSEGAIGVNTVACKEKVVFFDFSNLRAGQASDLLEVDATYADEAGIAAACAPDAPKPAEALGDATEGEALYPNEAVRKGIFIVDAGTRNIVPRQAQKP